MELVAPKGAVSHGAFNWQYSLLAICITLAFTIGLELNVLVIVIVNLLSLFNVEHVNFCPFQSISNGTGLERLYYHFCQDFSPGFIHPSKDKVSCPHGVYTNSLLIIHAKYFFQTLSSNGLFKHLSGRCNTGVRPPGMTATSIFRCLWVTLTSSVKWAQKESHTKGDRFW